MLDFLGIGAQKCATTWMAHWLAAHPEVLLPGGKEVHYWDAKRIDGYPVAWWQSLFAAEQPGIKQGEITPAYAILSPAIISEIQRLYPSVRLLYNIRNPIDRTWSHARMWMRRMDKTAAEVGYDGLIEFFDEKRCRERSDYVSCLSNWQSAFDEKQLLVTFHDDIIIRPRESLCRIASHIGIDADFFQSASELDLLRHVKQGQHDPLPEPLFDFLANRYSDDIAQLSQMFDRNLDHWLDRQRSTDRHPELI